MCEIYITAGKFDVDFLNSRRTIGESGRGFALIYTKKVVLLRDLDSERVTEAYLRKPTPIVSIMHLRVPTHGAISVDNTQPFTNGAYIFAHNGALRESYHLLKAMYPHLRDASDSRLLWEFLQKLPWEQAISLLRALGDRFVLANVPQRRIALIGNWRWDRRNAVWDRGFLDFRYVLLDYSSGELKIVESEEVARLNPAKGHCFPPWAMR